MWVPFFTSSERFCMKRLLLVAAAALGVLAAGMVTPLHAQGVTTGGLTGIVTDDARQPIDAARVKPKNNRTARITGALTRASGLYLIQGIEPDANSSIIVRRIGFEPQTRDRLTITLNQTRREDFKMARQATVLNKIQV